MGRKPKFRPKVTKIKLNPEQAVLSCSCYNLGVRWAASRLVVTVDFHAADTSGVCDGRTKVGSYYTYGVMFGNPTAPWSHLAENTSGSS